MTTPRAAWTFGPDSTVHVLVTTRADGDFHLERVPAAELERRRRNVVDLGWTMPDEVHGTQVLVVSAPGEGDRQEGDAVVTTATDAVIGIWVGDCAPLALHGRTVVAGVHAGWRGLEGGILERAVVAARGLDPGRIEAVLGPCIHPCCYEFGDIDLDRLAARFGPEVRGRTRSGAVALDLPAAVRGELARLDVEVVDRSACTGCHAELWFSHRRRGEPQRQVMAVWRSAA